MRILSYLLYHSFIELSIESENFLIFFVGYESILLKRKSPCKTLSGRFRELAVILFRYPIADLLLFTASEDLFSSYPM